jgi:hypothetical protein
MPRTLSDQWSQAHAELRSRLSEAERIGIQLVQLGLRLKDEPWRWALGWMDYSSPGGDAPVPVEPAMEEALDRNRLMWLLDDIRILRRREAELRRLLEDATPRVESARASAGR